MSGGTVYKRGEAYWLRYITPGGERVNRTAHTADEQEARQLLKTFTALVDLCHLYAVPFDPEDTLADVAHELVMARDELEHVFGQIRCPHCSRRIVPEWKSKALEEQEKVGHARERHECGEPAAVLHVALIERIVQGVVAEVEKQVQEMVRATPGKQFTEQVVQGVAMQLEDRIHSMVARAIGPRKTACIVKGCKDFSFCKGLCRKHYYRDYHKKRLEKKRCRAGEGK